MHKKDSLRAVFFIFVFCPFLAIICFYRAVLTDKQHILPILLYH
nr:MAG TPA: hypothetical protein [Caudoviricetes sp.]